MDEVHRQALRDKRFMLVRDMDTDEILDHINNIFTVNQYNRVNAGTTEEGRAGLLLDQLAKRGPNAFKCFCDALDETTPHLAEALRDHETYPILYSILER